MHLEWKSKPTSLAFRASVLTNTPPRLPDVTTLPMPSYLSGVLTEKAAQTIYYTVMNYAICFNATADAHAIYMVIIPGCDMKYGP